MGYYSDVSIICKEKAFENFKKAWEEVDFRPDRILKNDDAYFLIWEWVKWCDYYPEVQKIIEVMDKLDEQMDDEYGYSMIEIGEDNYTNTRGNQTFERFYVVVQANVPEGMAEIEV